MKLCECGCGQPAPIAMVTRPERGWVKGQAVRFIQHHATPLSTRFWDKVDKNGSTPSAVAIARFPEIAGTRCWEWVGFRDKNGYGIIRCDGLDETTHRISFFLTYGSFPTPCGLHKCDNSPCCNPDHIFEGTQLDNIKDRDHKDRHARPKGSTNGRAKLNTLKIKQIRILAASGRTRKALAHKFGITISAINLIVSRKRWKHVSL